MKIYSVWDSVRIFYLVVKFCGYISFSIDGRIENGRIRSRIFDILLTTFANSSMVYIVFINYTNDVSLMTTKSFIIDKGTRLVSLSSITNVFISSIINTLRRHEIWSIFKGFHDFDKQVRFWKFTFGFHRLAVRKPNP